uniref:Uncharacterized protein n=1 Tax=Lygus hesperus TaxID=30085 RepID=A0A146L3C0_LYGHE
MSSKASVAEVVRLWSVVWFIFACVSGCNAKLLSFLLYNYNYNSNEDEDNVGYKFTLQCWSSLLELFTSTDSVHIPRQVLSINAASIDSAVLHNSNRRISTSSSTV